MLKTKTPCWVLPQLNAGDTRISFHGVLQWVNVFKMHGDLYFPPRHRVFFCFFIPCRNFFAGKHMSTCNGVSKSSFRELDAKAHFPALCNRPHGFASAVAASTHWKQIEKAMTSRNWANRKWRLVVRPITAAECRALSGCHCPLVLSTWKYNNST